MKTKMAITGYVSSSQLKSMNGGAAYEVFPEADNTDVFTRVSPADIAEVKVGSAERGKTLVQLILKDNAGYETVYKTKTIKGIKAISDPALSRLIAAASAKSIVA